MLIIRWYCRIRNSQKRPLNLNAPSAAEGNRYEAPSTQLDIYRAEVLPPEKARELYAACQVTSSRRIRAQLNECAHGQSIINGF